MDVDDLVRDAIPVNQPYSGLLAEAYDAWLPPDGRYTDRGHYRRAIERQGGNALELGCGNGRLLLQYRAEGIDVEGVDASSDMLEICQAHADEQGLSVTLHHADWLTLDLGRRYATIYNPAGSFSLIHDLDAAHQALAVWRAHLTPGGQLLISNGVPRPDVADKWEWRVRRSATRPADGVTFMVHEAGRTDAAAQVQHVLNRHEVWDADGLLVTTYLRRHILRWWTPEQLADALRDTGYRDVTTFGTDDGYLAVGRAE